MKVLCKFCENLCKKIGRVECADYKKTTIEQLQKELNSLKVSKENPTRQKELEKKIDYFNWGIK